MAGKNNPVNQTVSVSPSVLKDVAENSMKPAGADLRNQSQAMRQLAVDDNSEWDAGPNPVFGSAVAAAVSLGTLYNETVAAISALADQFGVSVGDGATSLTVIADNYTRTDKSIAGD